MAAISLANRAHITTGSATWLPYYVSTEYLPSGTVVGLFLIAGLVVAFLFMQLAISRANRIIIVLEHNPHSLLFV